MVFNNDESIGYYIGMEKEKQPADDDNKKSITSIIIIILLVLILIGIIVVGIIIFMKKIKPRKNRANELDDDNYEYDPKDNQSDEKGNKLISNNIN